MSASDHLGEVWKLGWRDWLAANLPQTLRDAGFVVWEENQEGNRPERLIVVGVSRVERVSSMGKTGRVHGVIALEEPRDAYTLAQHRAHAEALWVLLRQASTKPGQLADVYLHDLRIEDRVLASRGEERVAAWPVSTMATVTVGNFESAESYVELDGSAIPNSGGADFAGAVQSSITKEVWCAPSRSDVAGIWNPATGVFSSVDITSGGIGSVAAGTAFKFAGVTEDAEGNIVFCPQAAPGLLVVDPVTRALVADVAVPNWVLYSFLGAFNFVDADGEMKVGLAPYSYDDGLGVYDPKTRTLELRNDAELDNGGSSERFSGGAQFPPGSAWAGKVVLCPDARNAGPCVYDPAAGTFVEITSGWTDGSRTSKFTGAAYDPENDRMILVGNNGFWAGGKHAVLDPALNGGAGGIVTIAHGYSSGSVFYGGVTLPNGKVICASRTTATHQQLIDLQTDTVANVGTAQPAGNNKNYGVAYLEDGRVFFPRGQHSQGGRFVLYTPDYQSAPVIAGRREVCAGLLYKTL